MRTVSVACRRRSAAFRLRAAAAIVLLLPGATGCYTYTPAQAIHPATGSDVAVVLSDAGRVALGGQVGPGARRIAGRLLHSTDTSFVLAVTSVYYLDAPQPAQWAGEEVRVSRRDVVALEERRLSRSRSWMVAGLAVAVAVLASTIALVGFGGDTGPDRPGNGGNGEDT